MIGLAIPEDTQMTLAGVWPYISDAQRILAIEGSLAGHTVMLYIHQRHVWCVTVSDATTSWTAVMPAIVRRRNRSVCTTCAGVIDKVSSFKWFVLIPGRRP